MNCYTVPAVVWPSLRVAAAGVIFGVMAAWSCLARGEPYGAILEWDAASEGAYDGVWDAVADPLGGGQVWELPAANPVTYRRVSSPITPGITAAFTFDGADVGKLQPGNPESLPLDPTAYSATFVLWFRPVSRGGGKQVLLSFGGDKDGLSLTLDNDVLRFQVRSTNLRGGVDTNSPPDGAYDDGFEDLLASIKTLIPNTGEFVQVAGVVEAGGSNTWVALYVNGAPARPLDELDTGLFLDETLTEIGTNFMQCAGTQGLNPLPTVAESGAPSPVVLRLTDWSGSANAELGRRNGAVGATAGPPGGALDLSGFANRTFDGDIARVSIYPRALSAGQVAALYDIVSEGCSPAVSTGASAGPALNYEAAVGALTGGSRWENMAPVTPASAGGNPVPSDALDWRFGLTDNSNVDTNVVSGFQGITAAFVFQRDNTDGDDGRLGATRQGGAVADSVAELIGNGIDTNDATIELWFRPADLANKQVLFETGGATDGTSLRLNGRELEFAVRHGNNPDPLRQEGLATNVLSATATNEFIQVVGVIDLANDRLRLYTNGVPAADAAFLGDDWDGGDAAALGTVAGALGGAQGSGYTDFDGRIAVLRIYGRALSSAEVAANYGAVAVVDQVTNRAPADVVLAWGSVPENQPAGAAAGTLLASDPDTGDTHVFALVSGVGDADNGRFRIEGAALETTDTFDYETRGALAIRVRATDAGGLSVERPLTVFVDDLNETDVHTQVAPNIIVYLCDDMGIGDTSAYLGQRLGPNASPIDVTVKTPNMERLAARGVRFTDVHTPSSMCSPTRYALLTGRYAWRSYNKHFVINGWSSPPLIAPDRPTLATLCRAHGYRTAAFGKWHLGWTWADAVGQPVPWQNAQSAWALVKVGSNGSGGYVDSVLDGPRQHGFERFFGLSGNFDNGAVGLLKAFIENEAIQGVPSWGGSGGGGPGVADWDQRRIGETYANRLLDYLDERAGPDGGDAPFFIYYAPNANHGPYDPIDVMRVAGREIPILDQSRFTDGSDGGSRQDMVYENDVVVGLLLDTLQSVNDRRTGRPMIDSTLIVFASDNGPDAYGASQAGLRDKKQALREGGHRIPFLVSWPDGGVPTGGVSTAVFGLNDLYASLASLLGHSLGADEAEDSENVLRALLKQVPGECFQRAVPLVVHDNSLDGNGLPDDAALAIRDDDFVLLVDGGLVNRNKRSGSDIGTANPLELYDLRSDLHQDVNLLGEAAYSGMVSNLAERLVAFNNSGYSRKPCLSPFTQLLHTDGGATLRNDGEGAVGYEFVTGEEPLIVAALGLWDDGAADAAYGEDSDGQTVGLPDGLVAPHTVRLFDGVTSQEVTHVDFDATNGYLLGEFRYVDLPEPIMLHTHHVYALTMSTAAGDGDLFHHYASFTGVAPAPDGLVSGIVARIAVSDGAYPAMHPDGDDGVGNRHEDAFLHRMFVGPNARIAAFGIRRTLIQNGDLSLRFAAGSDMIYRLEESASLYPANWTTRVDAIEGRPGWMTVILEGELRDSARARYYRLVRDSD